MFAQFTRQPKILLAGHFSSKQATPALTTVIAPDHIFIVTRYEYGYVTVCLRIMCTEDDIRVYCSNILLCYKFLYQRKWPRGRCVSISTLENVDL